MWCEMKCQVREEVEFPDHLWEYIAKYYREDFAHDMPHCRDRERLCAKWKQSRAQLLEARRRLKSILGQLLRGHETLSSHFSTLKSQWDRFVQEVKTPQERWAILKRANLPHYIQTWEPRLQGWKTLQTYLEETHSQLIEQAPVSPEEERRVFQDRIAELQAVTNWKELRELLDIPRPQEEGDASPQEEMEAVNKAAKQRERLSEELQDTFDIVQIYFVAERLLEHFIDSLQVWFEQWAPVCNDGQNSGRQEASDYKKEEGPVDWESQWASLFDAIESQMTRLEKLMQIVRDIPSWLANIKREVAHAERRVRLWDFFFPVDFAKIKHRVGARMEELADRIESLKQEISDLQEIKKELQSEEQSLKSEINKLHQDIAAAQTHIEIIMQRRYWWIGGGLFGSLIAIFWLSTESARNGASWIFFILSVIALVYGWFIMPDTIHRLRFKVSSLEEELAAKRTELESLKSQMVTVTNHIMEKEEEKRNHEQQKQQLQGVLKMLHKQIPPRPSPQKVVEWLQAEIQLLTERAIERMNFHGRFVELMDVESGRQYPNPIVIYSPGVLQPEHVDTYVEVLTGQLGWPQVFLKDEDNEEANDPGCVLRLFA